MRKIVIIIVALHLAASINAQQSPETPAIDLPKKRLAISAHPMWWLNNTFRFDVEFRLRNTPAWLQISPTIYSFIGDNNNNYSSYDYGNYAMFSGDMLSRLAGAGIEANYKYFIDKKEGWYVAGGVSYSYYRAKRNQPYLRSYVEHGLVYYIEEFGAVSQTINKIGMNAYIGYQVPRRKHFLTEFFTGLGYRHSFMKYPNAHSFNYGMLSPGHTGFVFILGLKLGVKFY
ncbi:MAG: hypothetical protein LBD59_09750 [Prevotellaceae bacterium]|jgi:hypothetical protein|nr:hypothetical protein [Prevotellaceae bacterium]